MKTIDLGKAVAVAANLGVILGIVFLAAEINQSNRLARMQMRNAIADSISTAAGVMAGDSELAKLYIQGSQDPESLSPDERIRLDSFWVSLWRLRENMYFQYRNGLFDEAEFSAERESWREEANDAYFRDYYCRNRERYSEGYIQELDALVPSIVCRESPAD